MCAYVHARACVRERFLFLVCLFVCLFAHVCLIYNMNKYGLCGVGYDCNCITLILVLCSILCTYYVFFCVPSSCLYGYSFHPSAPLITEHMIVMAATPKMAIEYKLFSI